MTGTMYDSGRTIFRGWSKVNANREGAAYNISEYHSRWLGPFDKNMTGEMADEKLNEGKLLKEASEEFIKGWDREREEYKKEFDKVHPLD